MSSKIELARELDINGQSEDALNTYLDAFSQEDCEPIDYINASFLCFIFQDFGFTNKKRISPEAIDKAAAEMIRLLDVCDALFGPSKDTSFWRKYYALILNNEIEHDYFCQDFLSKIATPQPPMNERERYINSIKQSH
jgi:hypothetical protein